MNRSKDVEQHNNIGCLEAIEAFYAYLDGELDDPKAIADFEHHVDHCDSCYSRAEIERLLTDRMRASGKTGAPAELQNRLRKLMDEFK